MFVVICRLFFIVDVLSYVMLLGIVVSLLFEKIIFIGGFLNFLYMGMIFLIGGVLLIEKL